MKIINIEQQTNTGDTLQDFLAVMPKKYTEGDLFRLGDSDAYCEYYTGRNKQVGVKLYAPEYFEGKLVGHQLARVQPDGKIKKVCLVKLDLPEPEVKTELEEFAESVLNSTDEKLKRQEKELKIAIAAYLKVSVKDIKAIITTPDQSYDVDLKNGQMYEITIAELEPSQKQSDEVVVVEDKKSGRKPLYIAPKIKSEVKAIRVGTKQEKIANLLINGATTQDLVKATGWAIASVKSALHDDMHSRKGYGIKQDGDKYYLVFPEGIEAIIIQSRK